MAGAPRPLAIVLADGAAPERATLDRAWPGWDVGLVVVVAADGGARHAAPLGLRVDHWVGDGDSVPPELLEALAHSGATIDRVPVEKDASDSELALEAALANLDAAGRVAIIGALGGARVDHALTNLGMLSHPALAGRSACLYDEHAARISLIEAPGASGALASIECAGRVGDLVTLVPIGGSATGVTTSGLRYPLDHEPLEVGRTRGVSNVRTATSAHIELSSGRLLVIETPANLAA